MTKPSPSEIDADLYQFAGEYHHNPIQHVILNPYQRSILLLRAKYATYETITGALNSRGVKVSEATVRKFCRTHHQEIKRLRAENDRKNREAGSVDQTKPASTEIAELPMAEPVRRPATMEFTKPGPKIAREKL